MTTSTGTTKFRPALVLKLVGKYQDALVCGLSSNLAQAQPGIDHIIQPADADYAMARLQKPSVVRILYLQTISSSEIKAIQGRIQPATLAALQARLAELLAK